MAAIAARISVNCGPMKFDTKNCMNANAIPQAAAAGQTPRKSLESRHHDDKIGRHEHGKRRADAADVCAEIGQRQSGDAGKCDDRNADRAERNRRCVGQ